MHVTKSDDFDFNPRIRIIGLPPLKPEGVVEEEEKPVEAVSIRAVIDVCDTPAPSSETPEIAVASSSRPGLSWDEAESRTAQMESWEDEDDLTVPRRIVDLREQARALAALSRSEQAQTEQPVFEPRDTLRQEPVVEEGPNGTIVELDPPSGMAMPPSSAWPSLLEDPPAGDTLVDAGLPSEIGRLVAAEESWLNEEPSEPSLPVPSVVVDVEEEGPRTQPSTPPARITSVDVALDELEKSSVLAAPLLPSILEEDRETTPVPQAVRTSSPPASAWPSFVAPRAGESLPPVAVSDLPAPPPRERRGLLFAAIALFAALVAGAAFFLYPRSGELAITVQGADGKSVAAAEISVDGEKRCDASCQLEGIAPGHHTIQVVVPGVREPQIANAEVTSGGRAAVTVVVVASAPAKAASAPSAPTAPVAKAPSLHIEVVTEGARVVLVAGQDVRVLQGPWPKRIELEPGEYKVVASRYGFLPYSRVLSLTATSGEQNVHIALEPGTEKPKKKDVPAEPPSDDIYEER